MEPRCIVLSRVGCLITNQLMKLAKLPTFNCSHQLPPPVVPQRQHQHNTKNMDMAMWPSPYAICKLNLKTVPSSPLAHSSMMTCSVRCWLAHHGKMTSFAETERVALCQWQDVNCVLLMHHHVKTLVYRPLPTGAVTILFVSYADMDRNERLALQNVRNNVYCSVGTITTFCVFDAIPATSAAADITCIRVDEVK